MENLDNIILEMTKETQKLTIEWCFQAIEKTKELNETLYSKAEALALERFPEDKRERIYAFPCCKNEIIEKEMGSNTYNVGTYFIQRGCYRDRNSERITNEVEKDFKAKRTSLKNKILKMLEKSGNSIREIKEITAEVNGTLGTIIVLENADKIIVEVIQAGGWNIQKFHFRGLCKLIKGIKVNKDGY